jgi:hypothetical protein
VSIIDGNNSLFVLIVGRTRLNDEISDASLSFRRKFFDANFCVEEYFGGKEYHSGRLLRFNCLSCDRMHN